MILPLKIALGAIVVLLLGLGGTSWYAKTVASERDAAQQEAGELAVALQVMEAQSVERQRINDRLADVLNSRSERERKILATSKDLQEKINALNTTCTFSSRASRLLWEIYERSGGVQGADGERPPALTEDSGASSSD